MSQTTLRISTYSKSWCLILTSILSKQNVVSNNWKSLTRSEKSKKKIRFLKQEVKISLNVKFLSNTLLRLTSISKRFIEFLMQNQFEEFVTSRKYSIRLDKISLYHEKLIKKHRDYVRNLNTIFVWFSRNSRRKIQELFTLYNF
jgi:hypothetical protein